MNCLQKKSPRGQIILLALVFFAIFLTVAAALTQYVIGYSVSERHLVASAQALLLAEAATDKAVYQMNQDTNYAGEAGTTLGAGTITIAVTNIDGATKQITATAYVPNSTSPVAYKKIQTKVSKNANSVTFHYGTQSGQGGIIFSNNAALQGNLYSNGNVVGSNGAYITGDTFVAGSSGSISSMCIGGTGASCTTTTPGAAHAHSVTNSTITGGLYCQSGSGNNKTCDTSQTDPASADMPVADADITQWKSDAAAGTVINGNYSISSGSVTLGPTKINGNLTISGNATVTIANTVWVTGTISFSGTGGGSHVKLANTYGSQSGILIADGLVSIGNNVTFQDSGTTGSYIMLLTTSTCDENTAAAPCSSQNAIQISNNASIIIANAQQGTVSFSNNATVKEVVAKRYA